MSNFIIDCINGDALLSDIDNYIDEWHDNDTNMHLHEFLGMTKKEYELFVLDESKLSMIVAAHIENIDVEELVNQDLAMAARSDDPAKSESLKKWLESEGLWD